MKRVFSTSRTPSALALMVALFACDGDGDTGAAEVHDTGSTEMSQLQIGCQHFEFGPHHPNFAAAEGDAEKPSVMPHNHYTVAIPAAGGSASFEVTTAGTYIFLINSTDATLTLTDGAGVAVAPAMDMAPGDECPVAAKALHFMLDAATYTVSFAGTATVEAVIHGPVGGEHLHGGGGEGGEGAGHGAGDAAHSTGGEGGHGGDHG